ncbi:MAG: PaaI family thioesterase [Balneolaceae bacterium]|nr:PaaI family thioesterase [Balneolaceae bacterium]
MQIEEGLEEKVKRFLNQRTRSMGDALGIQFLTFGKEEVCASMPVDENTIQPFGILHGGASVALAETVASIGAWLNIDEKIHSTVGIEINANHLKSVRPGQRVEATARPLHRGRQVQVWEVRIETEDGKPVCISRCTLAVVENRR